MFCLKKSLLEKSVVLSKPIVLNHKTDSVQRAMELAKLSSNLCDYSIKYSTHVIMEQKQSQNLELLSFSRTWVFHLQGQWYDHIKCDQHIKLCLAEHFNGNYLPVWSTEDRIWWFVLAVCLAVHLRHMAASEQLHVTKYCIHYSAVFQSSAKREVCTGHGSVRIYLRSDVSVF